MKTANACFSISSSNIRPNTIRMELEEGNYFNHLSIYTSLEEGERIEGSITQYTEDGEIVTSLNSVTPDPENADLYVTVDLNAENRFTRSTFIIKQSGVYKISVLKRNAAGEVVGSAEVYKAFSYSSEYDMFSEITDFDPAALMAELAAKGNGAAVDKEDPWSVFQGFVTGFDRTADPALAFMIIAAVLFLADIAVRKFKFKWPHEIVRDYREKREKKGKRKASE